MCTLIEKDILIEEVSATTAYIAYRTPIDKESDDLKECSKLRYFLLSNELEKINLMTAKEKLQFLKEKYINLPIYQYYLTGSTQNAEQRRI